MDTTSEGIIALDRNGIITAINQAARQFLGLPELMVHKPFTDFDPVGHVREVLDSGSPLLNKLERLGRRRCSWPITFPIQVGAEVVGEVVTFQRRP